MCGMMRKPLPGMSILVTAASAARVEFKRKLDISTWGVYEELGGSGKDYYKEFRNQEGYILLSLM